MPNNLTAVHGIVDQTEVLSAHERTQLVKVEDVLQPASRTLE
jgi:hypothetical protein